MEVSTTAQVIEWVSKFGLPATIVLGLMWWGFKHTPDLFRYLRERDALRAETERAWNELTGRFCSVLDRNTSVMEKTDAVIDKLLEDKANGGELAGKLCSVLDRNTSAMEKVADLLGRRLG